MYSNIISELKNIQSTINCGRGINCVDTLIFFLENNSFDKAKCCIMNEWVKISAYPVLSEYVKKELYDPIT